jgi:DNA-binding transcriptional LysR family regulator
MFLRQLEYLTTLARERHFGRAADACHVSQPALSTAIRKLEAELGVPLVRRGARFDDLTDEGRELLTWAQSALASIEGMAADASRMRGELTATLRLGVMPTAVAALPAALAPFAARHPGVHVRVRTMPTADIVADLGRHELDAGMTYVDDEPLGAVGATPLYRERLVLLTGDPAWDAPPGPVDWARLAGLPLCLLTPEMQNRRITDRALRGAGVPSAPRIEADSLSALLAFAQAGWSTVVGHTWLAGRGRAADPGGPRPARRARRRRPADAAGRATGRADRRAVASDRCSPPSPRPSARSPWAASGSGRRSSPRWACCPRSPTACTARSRRPDTRSRCTRWASSSVPRSSPRSARSCRARGCCWR